MTIDANIANQVQQLYVAYFNRPADVGGLTYWASVVAAQGGTAAVSASFAKEPEYKAAFAGKSSFQIVDQIYHNLFGRGAELGGLQYWGLLLDQGKITVDNVVTQVAGGAQGSDATAYNNKVAAAGLFTTALDDADSALAYIGTSAAQVAKDFISSITTNETFANATTPAALDSTITNLVTASNAQSNSPETVTLTSNFDVVGPTASKKLAGNDTFISTNPDGIATFNAFDSVDGGAGTDTFKLTSASNLDLSPAGSSVKNIEIVQALTSGQISGDVSGWTGLTSLTASSVNGADLTAAAGTTVTLTESISGASTTKVTGGSTVTVALTTGSATVSGATTISKGTGNLTYTHAGAQTGTTTLDQTTGNVTSTETGTTSGALVISKTTGNVAATRTGDGTGSITITGTTGTVAVTNTHSSDANATGGTIAITGGTTVNVTQATTALNKTFTNGTVNVMGTATTTAVTIKNAVNATAAEDVAGAVVGAVNIQDANYTKSAAGTITSATVTGFSSLAINDAALATLSVTGGTGNIIIDNTPTAAVVGPPAVPIQPTATTLALTINGQTAGTLDDADIYTTLNVTTAGTANSTLSNITTGAVTAITVGGTKGLTLTSATGLSALKTVVVKDTAGLTATLTGATITSVNTAASTGTTAVTIDGSKATYTGGAGVDTVTLATGASKAIDLGAGNDTLVVGSLAPTATLAGGAGTDTLSIDADPAKTASLDSAFAGKVTGFESLILTNAAAATGTKLIDVAVLGSFNSVTTAGGNGLTLKNLPTGGTLTLTGAGNSYIVDNLAFVPNGTVDTLNVNLTDASGMAVTFGTLAAAGVENFVVNVADTKSTPANATEVFSITGNTAKSLVIAGNAGVDTTGTNSTLLTNVDASGITKGAFTYTSGAVTAASTIKGSATGTNTVDFTLSTGGIVTYTGGTGNDVITSSNGKANVITLGAGTNSVTGTTGDHTITALGGADTVNLTTGKNSVSLGDGTNIFNATTGNNTYTGGKDADTITVTTGNNNVTAGDGANSFTATSGNNTYVGGAGVDTVTVGSGANTLTLGAGADIVTFTAVPTGVNSYSTITDAHKGMSISILDKGTESFGTKISLASTAVFQDYANAVIAEGGNSSVNGHWGYFTFTQTVNGVASTDTYLVQSRHDGSGVNPAFVAGTDFIVKLTGVVDLSLATGTLTNTIVLG